ncbi:MAG: hypothetical protein ACLRZN_08995 [Dialister invisus]
MLRQNSSAAAETLTETDGTGAVDIQAIGYVDTEAVENYLKEELKGTVPAKYEKEQGRVTVIK